MHTDAVIDEYKFDADQLSSFSEGPESILRDVRKKEIELIYRIRRDAINGINSRKKIAKYRAVLEDAYRVQAGHGVHPDCPSVSRFAIDQTAKLEITKERKLAERNYLGCLRVLACSRDEQEALSRVDIVKANEALLYSLYNAEALSAKLQRVKTSVRRFQIVPNTEPGEENVAFN